MSRSRSKKAPILERLSSQASQWAGGSFAFAFACATILVWIATGPIFHYSDTWQLVINTGTTVVTFLMVFLIQRAQNKESKAVQLKLNELVAAIDGASNRLMNIEDLSEEELSTLARHYLRLAKITAQEESLTQSHSVEEADRRHAWKKAQRSVRKKGP